MHIGNEWVTREENNNRPKSLHKSTQLKTDASTKEAFITKSFVPQKNVDAILVLVVSTEKVFILNPCYKHRYNLCTILADHTAIWED